MLFDIDFLRDFTKDIEQLSSFLPLAGQYFKVLALVDCYNYMIQLVEERVPQHPEIVRMPELYDMLLNHFYENIKQHINIENESIFNIHIVGTDATLRQWQHAGYPSKRTTSNYSKRLEYWKAIYNNETIKVAKRAKKTKDHKASARTGEDIFGPIISKQQEIMYEIHVKDRSGKIVTYEDVIKSRNEKFGAAKKFIPFWIPLNYGTDSGIQSGYPSIPGLHFIEDAERRIPNRLSEFASFFESFVFDLFVNTDKLQQKDFTLIEEWSKSNIKIDSSRINPFDFSRDHIYGIPF